MGGGHVNPSAEPGSGTDVCAVCDTFDIELCAILSDRCDYVGHSFIAIDGMAEDGSNTGEKVIVGFYPKTDQDYRSVFTEGSGRVVSAPGQVRNDSAYYKSGGSFYADKLWTIGFQEARNAHKLIFDRTASPGQYSLWSRQCNNFALEILTRAGISIREYIPPNGPVRPAYTFTVLSGRHVPAADFPPYECLPVTGDAIRGAREAKENVSQGTRSISEEWNRNMRAIERGWSPF
ncbi:hypothetical protein SAMN05444273_102364 [Litoreibacter ascidiaceicola]|uniref:Uncharacterized protein n=1 Tax=Litoreibacter ascidiaceicola TaxID=1486859 RepID=A0A1M4VSB6_9RHOB|nr:hypothetical protein [Litoreibacter ascidiaceicola]SHE71934.1 hypothetical protein SAMN05444273_102364 [Litoreibacter ascidiaceicola]